jgi:antitoxin ParD1/3/4
MTITLPDELKAQLESKARAAGFATIAEYVCWLVQQEAAPDAEVSPGDLGFASEAELEAKLLASLNSGPPIAVTPEFWDELRKDVAARAARSAKQS